MYVDYFYWQYIVAPQWLWRLSINLQRALWREFSVGYMFRTLFSHWHRDQVALKAGSLGDVAMALAMNAISRVMGFIVRSLVLIVWLASELLFVILAFTIAVLFLLWPLLVLLGIASGLALLATAL